MPRLISSDIGFMLESKLGMKSEYGNKEAQFPTQRSRGANRWRGPCPARSVARSPVPSGTALGDHVFIACKTKRLKLVRVWDVRRSSPPPKSARGQM